MGETYTYDTWMEAQGIPVHRGYYVEDLRTVELAPWEMRNCDAAFMQLEGMQGVVEARIQEIPPGGSLEPFKLAVDEVVYVLAGQGSASVWGADAKNVHSFEWSPRSMFVLPRNIWHQLSNMKGDQVVRLLHYNYMPLAMSAASSPDFFFNNPYQEELPFTTNDPFSDAKAVTQEHIGEGQARRTVWIGNFFPDMGVWDKLMFRPGRGSMNRSVYMSPPSGELAMHMSVFAKGTYKKGHRHGPGRVIVIPGGEGYSILWADENAEKQIIPWHEASCFVPPDRWFHQHFNTGEIPGRYLALHPPQQFMGMSEAVADLGRDQIEYVNEDPMVRERFESELSKRGLESDMPSECYADPDYVWSYQGYEDQ